MAPALQALQAPRVQAGPVIAPAGGRRLTSRKCECEVADDAGAVGAGDGTGRSSALVSAHVMAPAPGALAGRARPRRDRAVCRRCRARAARVRLWPRSRARPHALDNRVTAPGRPRKAACWHIRRPSPCPGSASRSPSRSPATGCRRSGPPTSATRSWPSATCMPGSACPRWTPNGGLAKAGSPTGRAAGRFLDKFELPARPAAHRTAGVGANAGVQPGGPGAAGLRAWGQRLPGAGPARAAAGRPCSASLASTHATRERWTPSNPEHARPGAGLHHQPARLRRAGAHPRGRPHHRLVPSSPARPPIPLRSWPVPQPGHRADRPAGERGRKRQRLRREVRGRAVPARDSNRRRGGAHADQRAACQPWFTAIRTATPGRPTAMRWPGECRCSPGTRTCRRPCPRSGTRPRCPHRA